MALRTDRSHDEHVRSLWVLDVWSFMVSAASLTNRISRHEDAYCNDCFPKYQAGSHPSHKLAGDAHTVRRIVGRDLCADQSREGPGRLQHLVLPGRLGRPQWRTSGVWGGGWDRRGTLRAGCSRLADQRSILPSESHLMHVHWSN